MQAVPEQDLSKLSDSKLREKKAEMLPRLHGYGVKHIDEELRYRKTSRIVMATLIFSILGFLVSLYSMVVD